MRISSIYFYVNQNILLHKQSSWDAMTLMWRQCNARTCFTVRVFPASSAGTRVLIHSIITRRSILARVAGTLVRILANENRNNFLNDSWVVSLASRGVFFSDGLFPCLYIFDICLSCQYSCASQMCLFFHFSRHLLGYIIYFTSYTKMNVPKNHYLDILVEVHHQMSSV